jgi:hypothetical protein
MTPACHPGRLWSLLEIMNQFNAKGLCKRVAEFVSVESAARGIAPRSRQTVSLADLRNGFVKSAQRAIDAATSAGFLDAVRDIERMVKVVTRDNNEIVLAASAETARYAIIGEFDKRKFLFVTEDRKEFVDHERLFGDEVYVAFPSARRDITEAGNCLAAECGTAAVFHLMRAAEVALRALCADRGKVYPDASLQAKQVGDLLAALDSEIDQLRRLDWKNWPSKDVKDAQIHFYHSALVEFRDFNEAWRRHMAHAHEGAFYNRDTALGILRHVRSLMQVLSGKISETATTPKFWLSA